VAKKSKLSVFKIWHGSSKPN